MKKSPTSVMSRIMLLVGLLTLCLTAPVRAQSLSVGIDFPRYNSSYIAGATIDIRVSTTTAPNTTVAKVEFFYADYFDENYQKIGEDPTAPYSYTWTIPTPSGTEWFYQLRAVVTDSQGNKVTANEIYGGYYNIVVYRPDYTGSRNWYVNAASTVSNPTGTEAAPFRSVKQVTERVAPGDTVFVMSGTYQDGEIQLSRTGLPNKWIVFMPYKTDKPILRTTENDYSSFRVQSSSAYLKIQGFEMIGNNAGKTKEEALAQPGGCQDPTGTPLPRFNEGGIAIDGTNGGNFRPHHITIANNVIHDCGGGGIGAIESDYITIENNTVYNTSWYTIYGSSGISVFHPWNFDTNTSGYRMVVRNNTVYGNRLFVPWRDGDCRISDGNGIILDDFLNAQQSSTLFNQVYTGRTLVANNLVYKNGGSGIIAFQAVNADIINNTSYQNSQSVELIGDVYAYTSRNVNFINNIIQPIAGVATFFPTSNTAVSYSRNLYLVDNPSTQVPTTQPGGATVTDNLTATTASATAVFADTTTANFRLKAGSIAIDAGSGAYLMAVPADLPGIQRPQGSGVDMGAYEFQGPPPGKLSVYHRDADNGQLTNNTIRPYLKLYNDGTTVVPYGELTVRYWLTVEDFAPMTNLSVYWAQLGTNKIKMKYVALPQPRQGALGYVDYSFDASAGNLAGGSNSGEIQTGIGKQNWTNLNEADDYSYKANIAYTQTDRITVYRNGALVGGIEPTAVAPLTAVKVYAQNKNSNPGTNQISTYLKVANEGNVPTDYSGLTVRYWFTADGDKPLVYSLDYAELGNSNVTGKFVKQNRANADTYLELSFAPTLGKLYPLSSTGLIQQRVNKSDWSNFIETNDYSYKMSGPLAENAKITAYLNGTLVYGQEPGLITGRIGVTETTMQVRVLGNPVVGGQVDVAVSGVEGQPLRMQLTDVQGRVISDYQTGRAAAIEQHRLVVGHQPGILLLQISTLGEKQTVKLLKQ